MSTTTAPEKHEFQAEIAQLLDLVVGHQEEGGKLIFKHTDGEVESLRLLWREKPGCLLHTRRNRLYRPTILSCLPPDYFASASS